MKICAMSDTHGYLPKEIPECDALLIAGDFCVRMPVYYQLQWLRFEFRSWLQELEVPVFACAGNHDWPFFEYADDVPKLPWTYLEDSGTEFKGFKIYGTPWQRIFYDWAFNLTEYQLNEKWNMIPEDTDILICHSPPKFFGDLTKRGSHEGSQTLLERIVEIKPQLVVFGHIHLGHGEWTHNGVKMANVAMVNEGYKVVHDPWVYELGEIQEKLEIG